VPCNAVQSWHAKETGHKSGHRAARRCDMIFADYLSRRGRDVTFRAKLFWIYTLAVLLAVALVAVGVTDVTRRAFDDLNRAHRDALVAQFQKEFERRQQDVVHRVKEIAEDESTLRMAIDLSRPQADVSLYVNLARGGAQAHQLDLLDFTANDGAIISSAEWPAHFGYKLDWVTQPEDWVARGSFLTKMDTPEGPALGLMAVSTVRVGDRNLYVVGGERLGKEFLGSLVLPAGLRAVLYLNLDPGFQAANAISAVDDLPDAQRLAPLIESERRNPGERDQKIYWGQDPTSAEFFHMMPLLGHNKELLGALLVGTSQREVVELERRIGLLALAVAAVGLVIGLLLTWWAAARITRPVQKLARGAREVAAGNWNARVDIRGKDEIGQLAGVFNQMTQQLIDQRERLLQAERVAAWRELARRLAHELKNPLFPLQTTVENLQRAKSQTSDQFEDVFGESTGILLAEIENLKKIISRFSDFAKMPQPELAAVNLNDVVRAVVKLFEAQFGAVGRPPITPELHLEENLPTIQADATLLHRAVENLVLNAMDAMPAGGVIMLRTTHKEGEVHLEVSDTGTGLTPEECERLFTPYYTTKQHGTGLGLAIVQSVVSDHGGRISVESETGVGTSFHIELPVRPPARVIHFPAVLEESAARPEAKKEKEEAAEERAEEAKKEA
jgi:two-component system, NtrC family, nitrogen regulation sensor histidine kinase NtrY